LNLNVSNLRSFSFSTKRITFSLPPSDALIMILFRSDTISSVDSFLDITTSCLFKISAGIVPSSFQFRGEEPSSTPQSYPDARGYSVNTWQSAPKYWRRHVPSTHDGSWIPADLCHFVRSGQECGLFGATGPGGIHTLFLGNAANDVDIYRSCLLSEPPGTST
jgi:hypothetical protein